MLDRVIAALHAQGGPARQHNGCFYRTSDGRCSALGSLIGDDLYADDIEDCDPAHLPRIIYDWLGADRHDDIAFLVAIETAHDLAAWNSRYEPGSFWSELSSALQPITQRFAVSLAKLHDLSPPLVATPESRPQIKIARLGQPALIWQRRNIGS